MARLVGWTRASYFWVDQDCKPNMLIPITPTGEVGEGAAVQKVLTFRNYGVPGWSVAHAIEAQCAGATIPAGWQAVYAAAARRAEQMLRDRWSRQHTPSLN